jgi:hypothetical protein
MSEFRLDAVGGTSQLSKRSPWRTTSRENRAILAPLRHSVAVAKLFGAACSCRIFVVDASMHDDERRARGKMSIDICLVEGELMGFHQREDSLELPTTGKDYLGRKSLSEVAVLI